MTILVTADLHLNNLPRDQYRHDFQKELRSLVKKHGVSLCVILGDLTDEKDFHSAQLVNKVVDHIYQLARLVPVVILKGNHDYTSLNEIPYFTFLRRIERVYWIGEPTHGRELVNLPAPAAKDVARVLFLPHSPNPVRDWKGLNFKGKEWIFAHNTFDGARIEGGRVLSGTSTDIFGVGAFVISGDIHTPQVIGKKTTVTYVGSPYRIDFGDDYNPRVLILKGTSIEEELCSGPRKQLITVKAGAALKSGIKDVLRDLEKGDILKVRVELNSDQYARWGELRDAIREWADTHGYVLHLIQPITERIGMSKKTVAKQAPKSDAELLKSFAKRQNVDDKTLRVGLDILDVS